MTPLKGKGRGCAVRYSQREQVTRQNHFGFLRFQRLSQLQAAPPLPAKDTNTDFVSFRLKTEMVHYLFQLEAQANDGREGNVKYYTSKDKTFGRSISRHCAQIISTKGGEI